MKRLIVISIFLILITTGTGANVILMFQNDKLVTKSQSGLQQKKTSAKNTGMKNHKSLDSLQN